MLAVLIQVCFFFSKEKNNAQKGYSFSYSTVLFDQVHFHEGPGI